MSKTVRLMVWNFLEGGQHLGSKSPDPDVVRLSAAQELVRHYQPDILVLNEALWCSPWNDEVFDYAQAFGFEYSHSALYADHWGNTILSRFPLQGLDIFTIYNRGGLIATANTPTGPLQVCTYHPHPSRWPENKAQDFTGIVQLTDQDRAMVLCGDFNAISPDDRPNREGLARAFGQFSANPIHDSARFIDAGEVVFPALTGLGLRDVFEGRHAGHSMPTQMLKSHPEGGMRIDHAWVNGSVNIVSAQVCTDPKADIASDHYPLILDIIPT